MSANTQQSIEQLGRLREEMVKVNEQARITNNVLSDGKISLREVAVEARLLTGGNPSLSAVATSAETTITVLQTLRIVNKALQVEMGPLGWLLLGAGIFSGVTAFSIYESQSGSVSQ